VSKFFGGFMGFLSWVWLLVSAATVGLCVWFPDRAGDILISFKGKALLWVVCTVLVFVAYLRFRARLSQLRSKKEIVYTNAIGNISISLSAIEDALGRVLEENDIVRSHEVNICNDSAARKLVVRARIHIWEVNEVTQKAGDMQQELKKRFDEIMPESEAPSFDVKVEKFPSRPSERGGQEKAGVETERKDNSTDETDYFTGLKYPIETDEEEE